MGFGELDKTKVWRNLVGVGAWRAAERFYAEDFSFLFDKTSPCCLCVCILLPYYFSFHITTMLYIDYGLE